MAESIYVSSTKTSQHWASVFEQMEIIASPEQVVRPMLAYAKQTILPKLNNSIAPVARNLASLLFGNPSHDAKQEERLQEFLNIAVFRLAQSSWADDKLARLVVSVAILAQQGIEKHDELAASTQALLINFTKRAIQTWSDPVFLKNGSNREKRCKLQYLCSG